MTEPNHAEAPATSQEIRAAVAGGLSAWAAAISLAALVVVVLAGVVWLSSATEPGGPHFPLGYLLVVLPMLTAAGTLKAYATDMRRPAGRPAARL